jgi:DNA modification methylase
MLPTWQILEGDCRTVLAGLPAGSVHTVVTSPPYFGLRDYGADRQIGLEPTPDEFVAALVAVFREVRRVLRDDGTVWLNLGDSYAGGGCGARDETRWPKQSRNDHMPVHAKASTGLKNKDLVGIPWMVAFALRADGWYLRSEIIWAKPNPMPESVADRPTKAHEQVFLLSKGPRYFYDADAIREADLGTDHPRSILSGQPSLEPSGGIAAPNVGLRKAEGRNGTGRNKRSVWTVATQPYSGAHFATFPPKLIEPCILAGCPERCCSACGAPWERQTVTEYRHHEKWFGEKQAARHSRGKAGTSYDEPVGTRTLGFEPSCTCAVEPMPGTVLDPFAGAGTTGLVALRHGRAFVGIELNPVYAALARDRIMDDAPLLNGVGAIP